MSSLEALQAGMAKALLAAEGDACPPGLEGEDRRRFRVYRNNVQHGLSAALADAYPATARLVGDAFFTAMARAFLVTSPPRRRSLALFGDGFAAFVATFPPAASLPYLADVARLERAVLEAQHEAEAPTLDPRVLIQLGDAVETARFVGHPAARLVASRHPISGLWRAQREGDGTAELQAAAETALVTRPDDGVVVQSLSPAAGAFADVLLSGGLPPAALAAATAVDPAFEPLATWRALLQGGAFTALAPAES